MARDERPFATSSLAWPLGALKRLLYSANAKSTLSQDPGADYPQVRGPVLT